MERKSQQCDTSSEKLFHSNLRYKKWFSYQLQRGGMRPGALQLKDPPISLQPSELVTQKHAAL